MNNPTELIAALAALAAAQPLMAHVKVKASAGLVHHASHGRFASSRPRLNRLAGELAGILSLSIPLGEYRRIHSKHHGYPTFAQPGLDEEAQGLIDLGFAPGSPKAASWRRFWLTLLDPRWHARATLARLKANFIDGPLPRTAVAWATWGGAAAAAGAAGLLPAFAGAVGSLLLAGSIGSHLELTSRHVWGITPASGGRERQLALSHWRLPAPKVPDRWTLGSSVRFVGSVLTKLLWRIAVVPLDLPHHAAHHLAWDAGARADVPAWSDAAQAFSERLRSDPTVHHRVYGSLEEPLDEWFTALERADLIAPRR